MTVVLSLFAAVFYGVGDFIGGIASRRANAITVLLTSYPVGGLLMAATLPFIPGHLSLATAGYGVGGGLAGMLGVTLMYTALTLAPMNVISPVTAVLAAIVPVVFGVATGERPAVLAWVGIVLGLCAVVLVTRTEQDHPRGPVPRRVLGMALLAGVGFGVYFICLSQADHDSGAWPVVISRLTSAILIIPLAWRMGRLERVRGGLLALTVVAGALDAGANLFFLIATRHGYLSLASVITSLYPAATVLLAIAVLREHTSWLQRAGLGLTAMSIVLITA